MEVTIVIRVKDEESVLAMEEFAEGLVRMTNDHTVYEATITKREEL